VVQLKHAHAQTTRGRGFEVQKITHASRMRGFSIGSHDRKATYILVLCKKVLSCTMSSRKGRKRKLEKELDEIVLLDSGRSRGQSDDLSEGYLESKVDMSSRVLTSVPEVVGVLAGQNHEHQTRSLINEGNMLYTTKHYKKHLDCNYYISYLELERPFRSFENQF